MSFFFCGVVRRHGALRRVPPLATAAVCLFAAWAASASPAAVVDPGGTAPPPMYRPAFDGPRGVERGRTPWRDANAAALQEAGGAHGGHADHGSHGNHGSHPSSDAHGAHATHSTPPTMAMPMPAATASNEPARPSAGPEHHGHAAAVPPGPAAPSPAAPASRTSDAPKADPHDHGHHHPSGSAR